MNNLDNIKQMSVTNKLEIINTINTIYHPCEFCFYGPNECTDTVPWTCRQGIEAWLKNDADKLK